MMIKKIAAVLIAASFAACGTSKNDANKASVQQPAPESASPEGASIPNFFVIKVPVDINGKELSTKAESKTFSENEFLAAESTSAAFEKGNSVAVADELDQDSSTSQWYYRGYNRGYYGHGHNRGYYGSGYGYSNPYYSYYGYSYNYGYYNYYNYNSCNYYVYRSPHYYY